MKRREFPKSVKVEIIKRATRDSVVYCEKCGLPTKRFEIDHTIAEEFVVDKSKRLTAADGRLLCTVCHKDKTATRDAPAIATARKREAKHLGAAPPAGNIKSPGFTPPNKAKKPIRPVANGSSEISRRFKQE